MWVVAGGSEELRGGVWADSGESDQGWAVSDDEFADACFEAGVVGVEELDPAGEFA